jgi:hypothetical protein
MPGHVSDLSNAKVDAERKVHPWKSVSRFVGAAELQDVDELDDSDPHIDEVTHQDTGTRVDVVADDDIYPLHSNNNLGDDVVSAAETQSVTSMGTYQGRMVKPSLTTNHDVDAGAGAQQQLVADIEELGVLQPAGQTTEDQIQTELQNINNLSRYKLRPRQLARQDDDYLYTFVNISLKKGIHSTKCMVLGFLRRATYSKPSLEPLPRWPDPSTRAG